MNEFEKAISGYYTKEQYERIRTVRIGIAGAGGLGSNIALILTRSGFRNFEILDFDAITAANLNRQQYYLNEIGDSKVIRLREHIQKINPAVNIVIHKTRLTVENHGSFFNNADILFEAFDTVESKKLLLENFGNSGKIIIMGSGMAGIKTAAAIKIRKAGSKHYIVGDETSDVREGLLPYAPRVIQCAAAMASVALEVVCG
jgi:sulfur carrier protein ThiS adenylyltransferase